MRSIGRGLWALLGFLVIGAVTAFSVPDPGLIARLQDIFFPERAPEEDA